MRSLHIKRAVAFLLLFALLIGVMPVSAFAEDTDHPVEAVITEVNETAEATTEPPVDDTSETPATETSDPIETAPAETEIPDGSVPVEPDPNEEPATEAQESADVTDQNDIPAETDPEQSKVPEETVDVPAETEQPEETSIFSSKISKTDGPCSKYIDIDYYLRYNNYVLKEDYTTLVR